MTFPQWAAAELITAAKLNLGTIGKEASIDDLKGINTTLFTDIKLVYVTGTGLYRFDPLSSATADGLLVVQPTTGSGRWYLDVGLAAWTALTLTTSPISGKRYRVNAEVRRATLELPTTATAGWEMQLYNYPGMGYAIPISSTQTVRNKNTTYNTESVFTNSDANSMLHIVCNAANDFTIIDSEGTFSNGTIGGAGYILGGQNNSSTSYNVIQKLTYNGESMSTLGATLDAATAFDDAGGQGISGPTKGYLMGGSITAFTRSTRIEDFVYSGESSALIAAALAAAIYCPGVGSSSTQGYVLGGQNGSGSGQDVATIQKLTYSSDAISTHGNSLSIGRSSCASLQSDDAIYLCNGRMDVSIPGLPNREVERFDLLSGTSASLGAVMTSIYGTPPFDGLMEALGTLGIGCGFVWGGSQGSGGVTDKINQFTYGNQTSSTIGAVLASSSYREGASISSVLKGYYCGGGGASTTVQALHNLSKTRSTIAAVLHTAKRSALGVSNFG